MIKHSKPDKVTDPDHSSLLSQGAGPWNQELCQPQAVMAF